MVKIFDRFSEVSEVDSDGTDYFGGIIKRRSFEFDGLEVFWMGFEEFVVRISAVDDRVRLEDWAWFHVVTGEF